MRGVDPNGKVWDDPSVDAAIFDAFRHIQRDFNLDLDACKGSFSLVTVPGQQEYPISGLASDFVQLRDVIDATGMLLQPDDKENLYSQGFYNLIGQQIALPSRRYFFNGNIGLYPTPSTVQTLMCFYRKSLPLPTSDGVTLSPLPVDFDRAIGLLGAYYLWSQPQNGYPQGAIKMENQYRHDELPSLKAVYAIQDRKNAYWGVKRRKYSVFNDKTSY